MLFYNSSLSWLNCYRSNSNLAHAHPRKHSYWPHSPFQGANFICKDCVPRSILNLFILFALSKKGYPCLTLLFPTVCWWNDPKSLSWTQIYPVSNQCIQMSLDEMQALQMHMLPSWLLPSLFLFLYFFLKPPIGPRQKTLSHHLFVHWINVYWVPTIYQALWWSLGTQCWMRSLLLPPSHTQSAIKSHPLP